MTLHAVDVNRHGDIVLSLQRAVNPKSALSASERAVRVEATDDVGGEYEQLGHYNCWNTGRVGYWITTLKRQQAKGSPQAVTLIIYPCPSGVSAGEVVRFDVPLPPRQKVDDVLKAATEVTQY